MLANPVLKRCCWVGRSVHTHSAQNQIRTGWTLLQRHSNTWRYCCGWAGIGSSRWGWGCARHRVWEGLCIWTLRMNKIVRLVLPVKLIDFVCCILGKWQCSMTLPIWIFCTAKKLLFSESSSYFTKWFFQSTWFFSYIHIGVVWPRLTTWRLPGK